MTGTTASEGQENHSQEPVIKDEEAQTTNGHSENHDDERPSKRRRVSATATATPAPVRKKIESPPWKKVAAEGPSTFTVDGKRKSARTNTIPLELQPPSNKRQTRGAVQKQVEEKGKIVNGSAHKAASQTHTPTSSKWVRKSQSTGKIQAQKPSVIATPPKRSSQRRSLAGPPSPTPTQPPKKKVASSTKTHEFRQGSRRSTRVSEAIANGVHTPEPEVKQEADVKSTPRIRFRVKPRLVHPEHVPRRPKLFPTLQEYIENAVDIPIDAGGLFDPEDNPKLTDEVIRSEALNLLRMEEAAEPGGVLVQAVNSIFDSQPAEEPPRQYAHQDHMARAAREFRRLMVMEQNKHRRNAKRLAEACRDEWVRRQPKTEEQIAAEALRLNELRYRIVMKTLIGTWENVKAEVNRRRLAEWEEQEQIRVRKALNEAVDISTQKLEARMAQRDSEALSDDENEDDEDDEEDEDDGSDSSDDAAGSTDDESNMSTSESDSEPEQEVLDTGDENLTVEQLRQKYSNIPDIALDTIEADDIGMDSEGTPLEDNDVEKNDDDSDESIDMDDDLGSSDEQQTSDEDSEDESEDDQGASSLWGFLAPSERATLLDQKDGSSPNAEEAEENKHRVEEGSRTASPRADAAQEILENDTAIISDEGAASKADSHLQPEMEITEISSATDTQNGFINGHPKVNGESTVISTSTKSFKTLDEEDEVDLVRDNLSSNDILMDASNGTTNGHHAPTNGNSTIAEVAMADLPSDQLDKSHPPVIEQLPTVESAPEKPAVPEIEISDAAPSSPPTSPHKDAITSTKTTEDSASSMDLQRSHHTSSASTPQPGSKLKTPVPFLLRGTLREYQHYGLDWLAGLYDNNTNGILADEMGLGKTIQTIALLAHLACEHEVWGPHLVIVPTSVMLNWEMEFKKWCPGFKIMTYYGTQEERKRKRQGWNQDDLWNVCITSYQLVLQDQQVFKRRRWHYMILDEAHNIKNFRSQRWQTLLGFNTRARLLLTGTPLQNNLTELWSLLFFLMPADGSQNEGTGFADLKEFSDWFRKPQDQILENGRETMDEEARAIISKLHKVLRPYLLRRIKADVEKQMPAKYEHVEFCRLSRRQRELYDGFLSRSDTRGTLASGNYLSIINCLMQLRKVCNHPDLFQEREIVSSWVQRRSILGQYEFNEQLIRRKLLYKSPMSNVSLEFLNMVPLKYETISTTLAERTAMLSAQRILSDMRDVQRNRAQYAISGVDSSTVQSNIAYLESSSRWSRFEELQHVVYLNAIRRQARPIYGKNLRELLTIGIEQRPFSARPSKSHRVLDWMVSTSSVLKNMVQDISQRSEEMQPYLQRFACVTPPVLARDALRTLVTRRGTAFFQSNTARFNKDPYHEARIRLSLQFPDKRLLQYDCGKLQALDKLLRKLQAGGHRALIFTQMTKVLDILEQFLNIHGHKYLRLDGSTKIEQRQILTDRFNNDTRILAFILSSRSGGLGINLTGADTVIFYDLDWNPAMDKQCQDRCHRIGQTRDVHIYRLVSEHTIEANILRKANQKRMLDDVVIQEGEFTTDYFNKMTFRDVLGSENAGLLDGDDAAGAAVDRVLGGPGESNTSMTRILEQAEDQEDVAAAKVAQREVVQTDAMDFDERAGNKTPGIDGAPDDSATPAVETGDVDPALNHIGDGQEEAELNAWGKPVKHMDDYMLSFMSEQLKNTPLELPKDKNARKRGKGRDRKRPR